MLGACVAYPGDLILTKTKAPQASLGIPISVVVPGGLEAGIDAEIFHVFGREVNRNDIPHEKLHQVKRESIAAAVALFDS